MESRELRELAARRLNGPKKITLVVSDIEGCLNLDERTYDFEALEWIRLENELANHNNALPFVTVCSGRQHAFVEAFVRFLSGRVPALFEGGCGLFFPERQLFSEYEWHPAITDNVIRSTFLKVKETIAQLCDDTCARRVIGKEVLLSLHPAPPMSTSELRYLVDDRLRKKGLDASVTNSSSAVDIAPKGIDKGTGLQWLISRLDQAGQFDLTKTVGIGDSNGDLPFMILTAYSAAPANAASEVKAISQYCSPAHDGRGVADILRHCISVNLSGRSLGDDLLAATELERMG